eukprot:s2826_g2.t1
MTLAFSSRALGLFLPFLCTVSQVAVAEQALCEAQEEDTSALLQGPIRRPIRRFFRRLRHHGVAGPGYYKPGYSGYYATTMPQPSDNADTIAPASTPSDNQDTIAPASTPSDNQDTIAPASTPGDNEDTVAPASTPVDNQDTIAPASTPGDNEDTVAPASTSVDNQDTVAPTPTPGDNEDTVAPASTPVDNQDTIVPDLPPGDNEAPAPIINVVTPSPTDAAATTNTTTLPPDATTNTTTPPVATTNTTTLAPAATTNTTLPPLNATNTTTAEPVIAAPATPDTNSDTDEACAANGEVCDTMNCCSAECLHTANGTFRCAQCVEGALCARCELSYCDREVECCFGLECRGGYDSTVVNSTGWKVGTPGMMAAGEEAGRAAARGAAVAERAVVAEARRAAATAKVVAARRAEANGGERSKIGRPKPDPVLQLCAFALKGHACGRVLRSIPPESESDEKWEDGANFQASIVVQVPREVAFDYVLARNSGPSKQSEQHPIQASSTGVVLTQRCRSPICG